MWKEWSQKRKLWTVFVGSCLFLEIFFVLRAFLGFNTADEMYFAGTMERVFRGERILIDEWNPTQQLNVFTIYPVYVLLRNILGSTEGIILGIRISSLVLHLVIAGIAFEKIWKKGWSALAGTLLFLSYAPFGIFTLSYNSIQFSVLFLLLACLYGKTEHRGGEYILYGILLAVLVLANPFGIFLYGGYGLLCLLAAVWGRKENRQITEILKLRSFLLVTMGAALVAALFAAFIFSRGSLEEILANLPHIVGDAEHQQGLRAYVDKTFRYFYLCYKNYKYMVWCFVALYLALFLDKNRKSHELIYMGLGVVSCGWYLIYYGFIFGHIPVNYQMLPLSFLGLEAYILTREKDRRLFYCWYLPAIFFTMLVQYATNTGIVTISAAYSISTISSVLMLGDYGREVWNNQGGSWKPRAVLGLLFLAMSLQFAGTLYLRMTFAWGDDKTWKLDTPMERGPLKGVYTTAEQAREYEQVLAELDMLCLNSEDQLLVVGVAPWIYLYTEAGCGSYSTWQVHENSTQLYAYYELHPDKFPTVIYMMHWGEEFMASSLARPFLEKAGYEVWYLERGIVMQAPERAQSITPAG